MLVSPPYHLKLDEAEDWLRGELRPVAAGPGVRSALISRLQAAGGRATPEWGWLVELEFETASDARGAAGDLPWVELMGDLRLLGMRPTVALVDGPAALEA